jgi:hypothetical protein
VGRDPVARAALDFYLLTLARNRALHTIITMNAALAIPVVAAGIWNAGIDLSAFARPRTVVLWIPLVTAFWVVIGLRAAFFVPSELPAAWTFEAHAPGTSHSYRDAARAAMIGLALPAMVVLSLALTGGLLGWQVAAWHTLYVAAVFSLLVEVVLFTIDHVPFTRAYPPGHAKLKSRWPLYLLGMYACAYWPVQAELRLMSSHTAMAAGIAMFVGVTMALAYWSKCGGSWSLQPVEDIDVTGDDVTALHILSSAEPARGAVDADRTAHCP